MITNGYDGPSLEFYERQAERLLAVIAKEEYSLAAEVLEQIAHVLELDKSLHEIANPKEG